MNWAARCSAFNLSQSEVNRLSGQWMPQKIKSNSSGSLSKHPCMNVISVLCRPLQVTHFWLPFRQEEKKKKRPVSDEKTFCEQWIKLQTLHKPLQKRRKTWKNVAIWTREVCCWERCAPGRFITIKCERLWQPAILTLKWSETGAEHVTLDENMLRCGARPLTWLWGSPLGSPSSDPPAPAAPLRLAQACRQHWSACSTSGSSNRTKTIQKY